MRHILNAHFFLLKILFEFRNYNILDDESFINVCLDFIIHVAS